MSTQVDVTMEDHGSVWLVTPITAAAKERCRENVDREGVPTLGNGFSCEPPYVEFLLHGMREFGLSVGGADPSQLPELREGETK